MGKFFKSMTPKYSVLGKVQCCVQFHYTNRNPRLYSALQLCLIHSFLVIHSVEGEKHDNNKSEKQSPKQDRYINCRGGISFPPSANTTMRTICSPVDFKQR